MIGATREARRPPGWMLSLSGIVVLLVCGFNVAAPALHPKVAKAVSGWAQDALAPPVFCGDLVKISYDPSKIADASPTYFNNATGAVIAVCDNPMATRGKIDGEKVTCPPAAWTCVE